ncbi:RiPP maturation radical SAM C-methyltransferase [Roseiconus lacunae]|uniref:RiPP maturation radical SAM C-methyltransferase n=1 Tax=Roseiconus lacunae TaxID=2605694 RepID=UPI001E3FB362|nr:RiPP maturation radical SAM C-methyltransferase [Roseiconus lacunae]MCD0458145.1 RiPP maturation radical SAM C-methyltransferase [Roseiconus lacunae]
MPGEVVLISMPWGSQVEPSLGLGILKSVLRKQGIVCSVYDGVIELLNHVRPYTYQRIADLWGINDFLFTEAFEREISEAQLASLRHTLAHHPGAGNVKEQQRFVELAIKLRQEVLPQYLQSIAEDVCSKDLAYVGFTCLFDQTFASLALATKIRKIRPDVSFVFGGYALNMPVGPSLQRVFSEMDFVAYGDGEPVVGALYDALEGNRPFSSVPNITYRNEAGEVVESEKTVKIELNQSPVPDFDDFYRRVESFNPRYRDSIKLGQMPVESSRGCWWGQKSHCIFCGIDEVALRYRAKDSAVVERELDALNARYGADAFRFSDYIMPRQALKDLLPRMAERGHPYELHYETKANLKLEEMRVCRDAGIVVLQPGIESFSTPVLKIMAKGVRAAQNIFTIFSLVRNHIFPAYNLIYGFPGETREHYLDVLRLVPALSHLCPPNSTVPAQITRYAPLHVSRDKFGATKKLEAEARFDMVFSPEFLEERELRNEDWVYYFKNPYPDCAPEMLSLYYALQAQAANWDKLYSAPNGVPPLLTFRIEGEVLHIDDSRFSGEMKHYIFAGCESVISEFMHEQVWKRPKLVERIMSYGPNENAANLAIDSLLERRVVVEESGDLVWLAFHEDWGFLRPHEALARSSGVDENRLTPSASFAEWGDFGSWPRDWESIAGSLPVLS